MRVKGDSSTAATNSCSGRVWGLARDDADAWQFEELLHANLQFTSAGRDDNGNLYVTAFDPEFSSDDDPSEVARGSLWQIVAADQVPEGAETAPPAVAEEDLEDVDEEDLATPQASPAASPEVED